MSGPNRDRRGRAKTTRNFLLTPTGSIRDALDIFVSNLHDVKKALEYIHEPNEETVEESSVEVDFVNKTVDYSLKHDQRKMKLILYEINHIKRLT